jgi:Bacterial regulatory proteins, gntR family
MAIDPKLPIPVYFQLKTLLLEEILDGRYGPDGRLPTEHQLCERHGISRTPVTRAIRFWVPGRDASFWPWAQPWSYQRVAAAAPVERTPIRRRRYSQRRLGGRCLVRARPMMAAFSSWLSSRLAGLRFGTIGNMPGRRAGPAVSVASDGGSEEVVVVVGAGAAR